MGCGASAEQSSDTNTNNNNTTDSNGNNQANSKDRGVQQSARKAADPTVDDKDTGVITARRDEHGALIVEDMNRWMGACADVIGKRLLEHVRIPGTHDSFTHEIEMPIIENFARCQNTDVNEQLKRGVRYFDCRIRVVDGEFWTYHGPKSSPFEPILRAVRAYLDAPGCEREVVILDMGHFENFSPNDAARLRLLTVHIFGEKLIPASTDLGQLTFDAIWATPARVAALVDDSRPDRNAGAPYGVMPVPSGYAPHDIRNVGVVFGINRAPSSPTVLTLERDTKDGEWSLTEVQGATLTPSPVARGALGRAYDTGAVVTVQGGQRFLFCHSTDSKKFEIRKLQANGAPEPRATHDAKFNNGYAVIDGVSVGNGRAFIYAQNLGIGHRNAWFLQEVLPNGQLGNETASGHWADERPATASVTTAGGRAFLAMGRKGTVAIYEVTGDGGFTNNERPIVELPTVDDAAATGVAFNGKLLLYVQCKDKRTFFVKELSDDGLPVGGADAEPAIRGALEDQGGTGRLAVLALTEARVLMLDPHKRAARDVRARLLSSAATPTVWHDRSNYWGKIMSYWPARSDLAELTDRNREILFDEAQRGVGNRLWVYQCQITPPENVSGFIAWLRKYSFDSLEDFALRINQHYELEMQQKPGAPQIDKTICAGNWSRQFRTFAVLSTLPSTEARVLFAFDPTGKREWLMRPLQPDGQFTVAETTGELGSDGKAFSVHAVVEAPSAKPLLVLHNPTSRAFEVRRIESEPGFAVSGPIASGEWPAPVSSLTAFTLPSTAPGKAFLFGHDRESRECWVREVDVASGTISADVLPNGDLPTTLPRGFDEAAVVTVGPADRRRAFLALIDTPGSAYAIHQINDNGSVGAAIESRVLPFKPVRVAPAQLPDGRAYISIAGEPERLSRWGMFEVTESGVLDTANRGTEFGHAAGFKQWGVDAVAFTTLADGGATAMVSLSHGGQRWTVERVRHEKAELQVPINIVIGDFVTEQWCRAVIARNRY